MEDLEIIVSYNTKSGFKIVHHSDKSHDLFMAVDMRGRGWQIKTSGYDPDDFRKLADYLEKIRSDS